MKKIGGLIFSHNSEQVDYSLLSIIAGGLAKKNLEIPFTLVTDKSTLEWTKISGRYSDIEKVFENIELIDVRGDTNKRRLMDGKESQIVPFINSSRSQAYELSPYDRTLLIDSDFLITSANLRPYLESNYSMMISRSVNTLNGSSLGIHDKYVSDTGISLFWATCMIFDKNEENKTLFSLVDRIKTDYDLYGDLYGYQNVVQFRNDIAFSISKHIMSGFVDENIGFLPPILTSFDNDFLIDVDGSRLKFLVESDNGTDSYVMCSTKKLDVHIMNKQSIVRNKDKLLGLL